MTIDIISDLHECFWINQKNPEHPKFQLEVAEFIDIILPIDKNTIGDVLIIAGDTGHFAQVTEELFRQLKKIYKEIIFVFGNHNLYLVSNAQISKYKSKSINRILEMKEICKNLNIYFLDGDVITIDGVKFGGACNWYNLDTDNKLNLWDKVMNDSRLIYDGYAVQSYGMYQSYSQPNPDWDTQEFYMSEQKKIKFIAEQQCDVFITHVGMHFPTKEEGMSSEYINDENNIFYYTDNDDLLKASNAKIHIFGHTHQNLDFDFNGIRMICQPLGYPSENTYNKVKQITL